MQSLIIVIRQPLERRLPVINLIDICLQKKFKITLLSSGTSELLINKYKEGVEFIDIPQIKTRSKILKIISWIKFRRECFRYAKNHKDLFSNSVLWIGSADTAIALGKELFQYRYIFQCNELYDKVPFYRRRLRNIMRNAIVNVNPNPDRGAIFRMWYNLPETPVTLPNKPLYHPACRRIPIQNEIAAEKIKKIKDKKIVLYMGVIYRNRDISSIAEAISRLGDEWVLVAMGFTPHPEYMNKLLSEYPNVVYIPPVTAPLHLQVASWAYIGVVSYAFAELNYVFCAPNKTWEYTGFGIPLLGNNIPGVMNDILHFQSGVAVNLEGDIDSIIKAIIDIDKKYNDYSANALKFYKSQDVMSIVGGIFEKYNS